MQFPHQFKNYILTIFLALSGFAQAGGTGAHVECWAPGLSQPIILNSFGQGIGAYAGRPWRYVIKGFAGSLTLGNSTSPQFQANENGDFVNPWSGQSADSWASVHLQINYQQFYSGNLFVRDNSAYTSTGEVSRNLAPFDVYDEHGHRETTLVFHLSPWNNQIANLTAGADRNRNPTGTFYIIADYYEDAPEPSGELEVDRHLAFEGETVTLSWTYDQGEGVIREQLLPSSGGGSFQVAGN